MTGTFRILVVEDDDTLRCASERLLRRQNHKTQSACNAQDALEILKAQDQHFDAVLCDWKLPDFSGTDLLNAVRDIGIDTQFIMVTGHYEAMMTLGKTGHFYNLLQKPYSMNNVLDLIPPQTSA